MVTYPKANDPVSLGSRADGTFEKHSVSHGATISIWENVKHHGAAGDGTTDDTAAIQAAIAAVTGAGSATSVRRSCGTVYLPPGTYKTTAPLTSHSTAGLRIIGAGTVATKIVASADMSQVFELDGFALGEMSNMMISGDSTHTITRGVFYHWDNTTSASGSFSSKFENVYVEGNTLNCDIGWAVGTDNTLEVDRTTWINCTAAGGQASASTGGTWSDAKWQYGWKLGSDAQGNCLDLNLIGCTSHHWQNGVGVTGTTLNVIGGEYMHNAVDFYHTAASSGYLNVVGERSEWSERLYDSVFNSNAAQVSFTGIRWPVNHSATDNYFIRFKHGGSLNINTLIAINSLTNVTATPKILMGSQSSMLNITGITVDNVDPAGFIDVEDAAKAQWSIQDFTQVDGATQVQNLHIAGPFGTNRKVLTYGATIASDAGTGNKFSIEATDTSAFRISNPLHSQAGMEITYDIKNSSSGTLGTITWGNATTFNPTTISSLRGWYDFSDATTLWTDTVLTTPVASDNDVIGSVSDKSGGSRSLTRGGGAGTEPHYKTAQQNALSVARFDGGDWLLSGTTYAADTKQTVIACVRFPTAAADYAFWTRTNATNNRFQAYHGLDGNIYGKIGTGSSTYLETWSGATSAIVISLIVNNSGAVSKLYGNGVLRDSSSGTPSIGLGTQIAIGSAGLNALSLGLVGDVFEVLVFNDELSSTDRSASEVYLMTKWGITGFRLAGAFTKPADTKRRTISFYNDGTAWVETNRAAADI